MINNQGAFKALLIGLRPEPLPEFLFEAYLDKTNLSLNRCIGFFPSGCRSALRLVVKLGQPRCEYMDNSFELPRHGGPHIHTSIATTDFLKFYYATNLKAAAADGLF